MGRQIQIMQVQSHLPLDVSTEGKITVSSIFFFHPDDFIFW